ncbi:MAG TPA: MFS transporter [Thermomicrobiales bacterium]|nr:MFS transporter [Thermomicrobiales bacterium]
MIGRGDTLAETAEQAPGAPGAPPAARAILGAALAAVLIAAVDLTVIATLLPRVVFDLGINAAEIDRYSWIVSGYLLAYLVTIPVLGRVSDLVGRRPVFFAALGVFAAGSVWCVFARGLASLVAARMVQGFGGGALVPVTLALAADLLPPRRRAAAVGAIGAADTLGWVVGPLWGAAVLGVAGGWTLGAVAGWRWVFALNVPLALGVATVVALTWRGRIPRPARGAGARGFDWPGALALTAALALLNLALSSGAEAGAGGARAFGAAANPLAPYRAALLAGAAVAFALFLLASRRAAAPLIPLGLFRDAVFSAANVANLLVGAALIVVMVDVPILVALLLADADRIAVVSGLLLTPFTLAMAAGAVLGGLAAERLSYRGVAVAGLLLAALGFWRMGGWPASLAYARMAADLAVCGLGFGLVIAPVGTAAINAAPRGALGIASSLVMVMRLVGMMAGISALTSWGVGRLDALIAALPSLAQRPGETQAAFLQRQLQYAGEQSIALTLQVLHQTFVIAGVICLVALVPALLLARRGGAASREAPPLRGLR